MKNRTALNKTCVDILGKMCYHIFDRRSDLGVVVATLSSDIRDSRPLCSAAALSLSGRALRIKRSRGKREYSLFNSIQLSFFQYIVYNMYFRSNLTLKVHIL